MALMAGDGRSENPLLLPLLIYPWRGGEGLFSLAGGAVLGSGLVVVGRGRSKRQRK